MRHPLVFALVIFISAAVSQASILTLTEYKDQVANTNEGYRAAETLIKSIEERMAEASTDFMPTFNSTLSYQDTKYPFNQLFAQELVTDTMDFGIQAKLRTGTQISVGYNIIGMTPTNSPFLAELPGFTANSSLWTASPTITITQPLWKDFNARVSKANEDVQLDNYRAQSLEQTYALEQIDFNAETAYWQLVLSRVIVKFDLDSLARTQKILEWNKRRVKLNIADQADLLQAEAALKSKELQYRNDLQNQRAGALAFNALRNIHSDTVDSQLDDLESGIQSYMTREVKRLKDRADLQATLYNADSTRTNAVMKQENVKPQVNIFGTYQGNGIGSGFSEANGLAFNPNTPTVTVGVNISVPLDFDLVRKVNQGYDAASLAADMQSREAKFDLDQDWQNLLVRFKDAEERLQIARDLEKLQEEKLSHERTRFRLGRTTSFQVLTFEGDYSDAQLTRLRIENEIITLHAQAALFNNGAEK